MHEPLTWILVADAFGASIYTVPSPARGLGETVSAAPRAIADRPPGCSNSDALDGFARELCRRLDEAAGANRFQRLVLVAPPRLLGRLRHHLSERTRRLVAREIAQEVELPSLERLASALCEPRINRAGSAGVPRVALPEGWRRAARIEHAAHKIQCAEREQVDPGA